MATTASAFDVEAGDNGSLKESGSATLSVREEVHKSAGVKRMEAVAAAANLETGRWSLWVVAVSVFLMYWAYCQQSSTTYSYSVWATSSFAEHSSGLASMSIATSIVSSVCLPFLAKLSDVFSRPWLCVVSLVSYVIGFAIILKSPTLAAYVVGNVCTSIGSAGLGLLSSILCADLVPLRYRGLSQGILSAPYIVIPWYSSEIVAALANDNNWRWGYGMYVAIMPCVMGPGIAILFWLEHRANKSRILNAAASGDVHAAEKAQAGSELSSPKMGLGSRIVLAWHELDGFGLLLLGFGWSLSGAKGGYSNPSLIAMYVVGALCLVAYPFYEYYGARFPSAPMRLIKNRTFVTAIIIDFIYMVAGYMQLLYLSSYVYAPPKSSAFAGKAADLACCLQRSAWILLNDSYVVTDYTAKEWNYYNNTLTMGLCGGGVVAGILLWWTQRYKFLQILGLCTKIVGYGLLVDKNGVHDTGRLVASQALTGIGGSFSVIGSQVASQAAVPHQDVALAIALLSLWSSIGSAIGDAVAASVWGHHMPGNLAKFLPASVNETERATFFGDITTIKAYPFDSEIRQGAIRAYEATVYPLWAAALGLSFIALIAACFQSNYFLGSAQNAYDKRDVTGRVVEEGQDERVKATGWRRVLRFWDL
ncbi:hypothetical protein JCM10213v2_001555 [Rhodosporidiobolus nylandii]